MDTAREKKNRRQWKIDGIFMVLMYITHPLKKILKIKLFKSLLLFLTGHY